MEKTINTKDLRLAQIRYFETSHNGVEVPSLQAYAFLQKIGKNYINILNPEAEYAVYDRVPYGNTTRDGVDYGTKIIRVSGEEEDGPCYVMEKLDMDHVFGVQELTKEQIEKIVLVSDLFFLDRPELLKRKGAFFFHKKLKEDEKKKTIFLEYLDSKEKEKVYQKKD